MSTNTSVWIACLVAALGGAVLLATLRGRSIEGALGRVRTDGDLDPLLQRLGRLRLEPQLDAWNKVIRRLWDAYERELAARLIRSLGERHSEQKIAQYWLDQLQRVEPEIAREALDDSYLAQHYRPDLAAKCGAFG